MAGPTIATNLSLILTDHGEPNPSSVVKSISLFAASKGLVTCMDPKVMPSSSTLTLIVPYCSSMISNNIHSLLTSSHLYFHSWLKSARRISLCATASLMVHFIYILSPAALYVTSFSQSCLLVPSEPACDIVATYFQFQVSTLVNPGILLCLVACQGAPSFPA